MGDDPTTLDLPAAVRKFSPASATDAELSDLVGAIEDALRRYTRKYPTEAETRDQLESLRKAASSFSRALRATGDVWHRVQRQDKEMHKKAYLPPSHAYLGDLERIQAALDVLTLAPRKIGRGIDMNRRGLAIELAMIWMYMTRRRPGISKASSYLDPRTRFAQFVAAALSSSSASSECFDPLRSNFADFLSLAAKEARALPGGGGETNEDSAI